MIRSQLLFVIVLFACSGATLGAEPQWSTEAATPSKKEKAADSKPFPFSLDETNYGDSDKEVAGTRDAVLLSTETPESRLITVTTKKHWDAFVDGFAKLDKETGKPLLMAGKSLGNGVAKKADFVPDFDNEAVLVLFSKKNQQIGHSQFMDIQVFEHEGQLRAYAFFGPTYHEKNPLAQPYNEPVQGYFYLVTIPRKLAEQPVEFRMAEQTWGRICSTFSPPITIHSKVEE